MTDCLSCEKRVESNGAYFCQPNPAEPTKVALITKPDVTASPQEIKQSLLDEGNNCEKYVLKADFDKKKVSEQQQQSVSPTPRRATVSLRSGLGWIVAASLAGVLLVTYLLILAGVI